MKPTDRNGWLGMCRLEGQIAVKTWGWDSNQSERSWSGSMEIVVKLNVSEWKSDDWS